MRSLPLAAALTLAGCANLKSTRFTPADELKQLVAQPKPAKVFGEAHVAVDRWELEGPLPTSYADAVHESASPFAATLAGRAPKGVRLSSALACVARETSRFVASKGGAAPRGVRAFIAARCGVSTSQVRTEWLSGKQPASVTDEVAATEWAPSIAKVVDKLEPGARAGIGHWREGETLVVTVASVVDTTTLEPVEMIPGGDGFVWIRGTTSRAASSVYGDINQGPRGFAECVNTEARAAPAFELKCPTLKTDEQAWISIGARERGRILGFEIVRLLVLPSGGPAKTYVRPTLVDPAPGATPEDFLRQLNAVRAQQNSAPLTLSPAQSDHQRELAPYFFEANQKGDSSQVDRIALGVMAGWRVEQEIMRGGFGASAIDAPTTAELLAELLEGPAYRESLLSPRAGVLAIGLFAEEGSLGGLFSTYEPVKAPKWPDTADKLLTELNGRRARNGKKPTQWVLMPSSVEANYAEAVATGKYDDEEALSRFMASAVEVTRRGVHGWRVSAFDLDDFEWPAELLSKDDVEVMITVTTQRVANEPWSQYVVLLVILDGAAQPST